MDFQLISCIRKLSSDRSSDSDSETTIFEAGGKRGNRAEVSCNRAIPILLALHYFCERKRIIPKASAAIDRIVRMCADARSRHLASEDDVSPS